MDGGGEEQYAPCRTSVEGNGPVVVGPCLTAGSHRGEEEDVSALKKVESLRDAESVTSTSR